MLPLFSYFTTRKEHKGPDSPTTNPTHKCVCNEAIWDEIQQEACRMTLSLYEIR